MSAKPPKRQRSPRGLLDDEYYYTGDQKWWDTRGQITNYISFWRQFATALIKAAPPNKKADRDATAEADDVVLDRLRTAGSVLNQIGKVETYLKRIEANDAAGSPPSLTDVHLIVHTALLLASRVHALTIADNETPIWADRKRDEGATKKAADRSKKAEQQYRQWQALAGEIQDRRHGLKLSDSAVAKVIEKQLQGTAEPAKWRTIRRHLK
jgi:hypothetical protein